MSVSMTLKYENHRRRTASVMAALLAALLSWSSTAHSLVGVAVGFSAVDVTVGQYNFGEITLTNINTGVDTPLTDIVDLILVTPSCDAPPAGVCVSGSEDPIAFKLSSGTGFGGTCSGYSFTATLFDAAKGVWRLTSPSPVSLPGANSFCRLSFKYTALNVPKLDTNPNATFVQTVMAATIHFFSSNGQSSVFGTTSITVRRGCSFDVDGNGSIDALSDGLLMLRAMFGLTGSAVTSGAVAENATRKTWQQLSAQMNEYCGTNFSP